MLFKDKDDREDVTFVILMDVARFMDTILSKAEDDELEDTFLSPVIVLAVMVAAEARLEACCCSSSQTRHTVTKLASKV